MNFEFDLSQNFELVPEMTSAFFNKRRSLVKVEKKCGLGDKKANSQRNLDQNSKFFIPQLMPKIYLLNFLLQNLKKQEIK